MPKLTGAPWSPRSHRKAAAATTDEATFPAESALTCRAPTASDYSGSRSIFRSEGSCPYTICRLTSSQRHENTHGRGTFFACHVCQRKFGRQDSLKRHIKIHAGNAGRIQRTSLADRNSPFKIDDFTTSANSELRAGEGHERAGEAVAMVATNQQNLDMVSPEYLDQHATTYSTHQTWPESLDLLELLINADAGWPMDPQLPLMDINLTPQINSQAQQEPSGDGSYARARQAMQHMSNLIQDLVSDQCSDRAVSPTHHSLSISRQKSRQLAFHRTTWTIV